MDKHDLYSLQTIINEHGALPALTAFIHALQLCADEYSDMGLKERAIATVEVAEMLQRALSSDVGRVIA